MSKKTSYLLGILITIIIGTLLYCYLCDDCYCNPNKEVETEETNIVAEPEVISATRNAFAISDADGDFNIKINDNFNFKTSNFSILEPISESVSAEVIKLKDYLLANPLKDVDITGYYRNDETNNSAFPNLGLARANAVKNYLVTQGVPSKQIDIHGELNDSINPDETNTLFGPLKFGMVTFEEGATDEALAAACDSIRKNPIVLYFKTGAAQINLTAEQRQKIADISRCVDKLGVKVQVVGHTDNTGNADQNMILGLGRADFAKQYLISNGILGDHIEATSKGQTQPIADNATEEGRTKNRRTEITIN
ncbi:OmpA family protein [Winogradskyella echinorum]|uniref:OmpA family protein n=1 Tax=Winogradskyella echinorum TaxID=538189 RepID=A0ABR6XZN7_9FLAO|nr:OmpA family protein [Winogradskyella echinorum]MBC3845948.1 OmpA family protein [Winogradskyella echinorum]MBC5750296.1 OmpA family protein [Winogradskyella echinorum]